MALNKLSGSQIRDGVLSNTHVASGAAIAETKLDINWAARYQSTLESKKLIDYVQLNNVSVTTGTGSVDVSKGAEAGKISFFPAPLTTDYGVTALYPIQLRDHATGNPIQVSGAEVWGLISWDAASPDTTKYTITYKTGEFASPTSVNMPAGTSAMDIQFPVRFNLYSVPEYFAMNEKFVDGAVDVTELQNLRQLAKDIYGTGWSLDNDGVANLSTSVADTILRLDGAVDTTNSIKNYIKVNAMDVLVSNDTSKGASLVGIKDVGNIITATTVEGALQEIAGDIDTLVLNLAAQTTGNGATLIGIYDANSDFTATTVNGALVELEARIQALEDNGGAEVTNTHIRELGTTFTNVGSVTVTGTLSGTSLTASEDVGALGVVAGNVIKAGTYEYTVANTSNGGLTIGINGDLAAEVTNVQLKKAGTKIYPNNTMVEVSFSMLEDRIVDVEKVVDSEVGRATTAEGTIVSNLASTANAKGASLIGVEDSGSKITATTVEGALVEIATNLATEISDLASVASGKGASLIGIYDTGSKITATTVEGALQELATSIATIVSNLAATTTGLGASLVGVYDSGSVFTQTTVEGILVELEGRINAIEDGGVDEVTDTHSRESNYTNTLFATGPYASLEARLIDIETVTDAAHTFADAIISDLAATTENKGASLVGILDTGSLYTAATVEAALAEVKTSVNTLVSNLAATTTGLGASLIGIFDTGSLITATTVEGALTEIVTKVNTNKSDLASTDSGKGATLIGVVDAGSKFTATTVEGVLTEIDGRVAPIESWKSSNNTKIHTHSEEVAAVTENKTVYTLVDTAIKSTDFMGVYVNGVRQLPTTHYTKTVETGIVVSITFSDTLVNGDNIYLEFMKYNS